jgi:hypothetical protein
MPEADDIPDEDDTAGDDGVDAAEGAAGATGDEVIAGDEAVVGAAAAAADGVPHCDAAGVAVCASGVVDDIAPAPALVAIVAAERSGPGFLKYQFVCSWLGVIAPGCSRVSTENISHPRSPSRPET